MSPQGLTTSMHDLLFIGHTPLQHLTEVRADLLGFAVETACARGTDADFDAIGANIDLTETLRAGRDTDALIEAINGYYDLIAAAAHNQILGTFIGSFGTVMRSIQLRLKGWLPREALETRREILALMRARDAGAASAAIKRHLEVLQAHVLTHLPEDFRSHLVG